MPEKKIFKYINSIFKFKYYFYKYNKIKKFVIFALINLFNTYEKQILLFHIFICVLYTVLIGLNLTLNIFDLTFFILLEFEINILFFFGVLSFLLFSIK